VENKNAAPLLRLVPKKSAPCASTIETATYLLQEAIAGRLKGLAYGAILADKYYYVDTTGAANTDPLFALGVIDVLRDKMCERHRE